MKEDYFYYKGKKLPYFHHEYNSTDENERRLEVAFALDWLQEFAPEKILEVGCVMPHYIGGCKHTVIDLYEENCPCNSWLSIDASDYDYKDKIVLSVSTLEHIKHDVNYISKTGYDTITAFNTLEKIYFESSRCFITWPVGANPNMDRLFYNNRKDFSFKLFIRDEHNSWSETFDEDLIMKGAYAWPFSSGNILVMVTK